MLYIGITRFEINGDPALNYKTVVFSDPGVPLLTIRKIVLRTASVAKLRVAIKFEWYYTNNLSDARRRASTVGTGISY